MDAVAAARRVRTSMRWRLGAGARFVLPASAVRAIRAARYRRERRSTGPDLAGSSAATLLVAAHPDDDLYFFNPMLAATLRVVARHLTVTLLTGEADGRNVHITEPGAADVPVDFEGYAAARAFGLRSAYGAMVLDDPDAAWQCRLVPTGEDRRAELWTLVGAPHISIMLLNIRDHGHRVDGFSGQLHGLWSGTTSRLPTSVPTGSMVTSAYAYTRDDILDTLARTMREFAPTVVWSLDPDPDLFRHTDHEPRFSDSSGVSDHLSHSAAGLFTCAALDACHAAGELTDVDTHAYRGYYVRRWPSNLSTAARALKQRCLGIYGWADNRPAQNGIGRGDRKVYRGGIGAGNASGTTPRYPGSAISVRTDPNGRLAVYRVVGGRPHQWLEHGPVDLGADHLIPYLYALDRPDGGLDLFGLRRRFAAESAGNRREVVTARVRPGDREAPEWTVVGNPDDHAQRHRRVGLPVAFRAGERTVVLVRNAAKGIHGRAHDDDGSWGEWIDLGGGEIQDGITVLAGASGDFEAFGAARDGIAMWSGTWPTVTFSRLDVEPPAGPPTVIALPDGGRLLVVRRPKNGGIIGYRSTPGAGWDWKPVRLGPAGGAGPVAAVAVRDELFLAARDDQSRLAVSRQYLDRAGMDRWITAGWHIVGDPVWTLDPDGVPVVAVIGLDGRHRVGRLRHRSIVWIDDRPSPVDRSPAVMASDG